MLFLAVAVLTSPAYAQGIVRGDKIRTFPNKAATGNMQVIDGGPYILMGKKQTRLSPGARIYGTDGKLILPGKLTGQKVWVNYTATRHGIKEAWILSEAEIKYFNQPKNRPPSAGGDAEVVPEKKKPVTRGK